MLKFINEILLRFRSCFSRKAAFEWFVIVVTGLMIRSDSLGITSIIRDLALNPALYSSLEHFFRAVSWGWDAVFSKWAEIVSMYAPLKHISGRTVLIGDGVKRASDGRYMPCLKKMVQESESASKPTFIHGHFFGAVGVLAGKASKSFCIPLSIQLHDGNSTMKGWLGESPVSHVVQMLRDGFRAARHFGNSLFVLDRYFLTVPLLEEWKALSRDAQGLIHIVTRAKKNCTAYESPGEYKGRGRRPVRGAAVRLKDLFTSEAASFQKARLQMYGSEREVRFLARTYLWGQKLYQPLKFLLVEYGKAQVILVCTDLSMCAEDIIISYAYRFKVEAMFREMKQCFGGFYYRFWSKAVPKLDRYRKKESADPLEQVQDGQQRRRVLNTVKAMEGYVLFSSIAMGIIQMLCLKYEGKICVSDFRYLRTPSRQVISEASMMEYLRRNLFRFMVHKEELTITKIISSKQFPPEGEEIDLLIS